jgi:hypothetical protein
MKRRLRPARHYSPPSDYDRAMQAWRAAGCQGPPPRFTPGKVDSDAAGVGAATEPSCQPDTEHASDGTVKP